MHYVLNIVMGRVNWFGYRWCVYVCGCNMARKVIARPRYVSSAF